MADSQVDIGLKLREAHCWAVTVAAICHSCGRIAERITFHGGLHLCNTHLRGGVQWQGWHLHLLLGICLLW